MLSKSNSMIANMKNAWDDYGLIFLAIISIIFILIYALTRIGKKGTFNKQEDILFLVPFKEPKKDSTGELICRKYLENRFGVSFAKKRPDFLRNPVMGGVLELDCYNIEMKLAVEYNGIQHYKFVPYFHKTRDAFANQKYRDEIKRNICIKHGILLIEVPYTVKHSDIDTFLDTKLSEYY